MTTSQDITATLAHHIVNTTPDTAALDAARDGVMDFVATALPIAQGAIHDSNLAPLRQVFSASDSLTRSVILGYMGHALDFDDYHPAFRGHPSTVILPALFALSAEDTGLHEADFLAAYVIGVEVAGRIGLAAGARHYGLGYHNTATLGAVAAAAAAARLLGASVAQTQHILGLAATQAAGLRAQFGSAVKPLHAGLAARAGLTAAKLALAGFSGNPTQVLDDFLSSHGDGQQHPEKLSDNWGTPWRIVTPGLEFKATPPVVARTVQEKPLLHYVSNGWRDTVISTRCSPALRTLPWSFPPVGTLPPLFIKPPPAWRDASAWSM